MNSWNNVQLEVSCLSPPECSLFSFGRNPEPLQSICFNKTKNQTRVKNKKIKCPPSKLLRQNPKQTKQGEKRRAGKDNGEKKGDVVTQQPLTFRPSLVMAKPRNSIPQNNFVVVVPKREVPQPRHSIPIIKISPPEMILSVANSARCNHEQSVVNETMKRQSKLSQARSFSSLNMQTVKSINDTTVDCVKLEESEIMVNFFQSRVGEKARNLERSNTLALDQSIGYGHQSMRNTNDFE